MFGKINDPLAILSC